MMDDFKSNIIITSADMYKICKLKNNNMCNIISFLCYRQKNNKTITFLCYCQKKIIYYYFFMFAIKNINYTILYYYR